MKYGYVEKINSAKELQQFVLLFEQRGVHLDNITINLDFKSFTASLTAGDTIVVSSYKELFSSLGSYLSTAIELFEKGILIESLQEPLLSINHQNGAFIRELNALNRLLRTTTSLKGIKKAQTEGKRLGRPPGSSVDTQHKVEQIEKICKRSGIPIVKACKMVGCLPRTYYRLKNKKMEAEIKQ